ncbi:MAG: hypothetical protein CFH44_00653, partial [Proteobacteria bacterium]
QENAYSKTEILGVDEISFEMLLLGFRLKEGLNLKHLKQITSKDITDVVNEEKLNLFVKQGLLEYADDYLRLTEKSYHLLNQIIEELLV